MTKIAALSLVCLAAHAAQADEVSAIADVMAGAQVRLHRCWEQAAATDWRIEGKLTVQVRVGSNARADAVQVTGDPRLAPCVKKVFEQVAYRAPLAAGESIEVPVVFSAEPNVTVRAVDVPAVKLKGSGILARVLLDERSASADKASVVLLDLPKGASWAPDAGGAQHIIYVLPDGPTHVGGRYVATAPTRLLAVQTPPGELARQVRGGDVPQRTGGAAAPRGDKPTEYPIAGGRGSVKMWIERKDIYVGRIGMLPGVTVPEHVHANEAEILYILSGKGEMTVGGQKYPVEPDMAIHVPPGAKHAFTATEAVEAVQVYAPSGPEQRFKQGQKR